jgi:hypothetical protein
VYLRTILLINRDSGCEAAVQRYIVANACCDSLVRFAVRIIVIEDEQRNRPPLTDIIESLIGRVG